MKSFKEYIQNEQVRLFKSVPASSKYSPNFDVFSETVPLNVDFTDMIWRSQIQKVTKSEMFRFVLVSEKTSTSFKLVDSFFWGAMNGIHVDILKKLGHDNYIKIYRKGMKFFHTSAKAPVGTQFVFCGYSEEGNNKIFSSTVPSKEDIEAIKIVFPSQNLF